jgi:hypothetical protein
MPEEMLWPCPQYEAASVRPPGLSGLSLTQSGRLARGHSETGAIDRLVPTLYPPAEPNPHKRVEREPIMGTDMWISIWAVTIALAIAFSVMAVTMQSENDRAALGR